MKLLSVLFTCALLAATGGLAAHLERTNALPLRSNQNPSAHFQPSSQNQ